MPTIYLSRGVPCFVDECDYPFLSQWHWTFQPDPADSETTGYAVRWIRRGDGSREKLYMHREITGCPKGLHVDHKDRNGLNNRRENLRFASPRQNNGNRIWFKGQVYEFCGVTKEGPSYRARFAGRHLGMFASPEAAARRRDRAALQILGPFAATNFPLTDYVDIEEIREELRHREAEIPF